MSITKRQEKRRERKADAEAWRKLAKAYEERYPSTRYWSNYIQADYVVGICSLLGRGIPIAQELRLRSQLDQFKKTSSMYPPHGGESEAWEVRSTVCALVAAMVEAGDL